MELSQIENTLKKMGLVIEKLVTKIDEMDKRVAKIEEKLGEGEKKFSSKDLKAQPQNQTQTSSSGLGGFGGSFLGSMAGAMAGMGLYNLLFNQSVSPVEMGHSLGMDDNEISEILEQDISEIDSKLNEIDSKLEELDTKIDELSSEDVMNTDYFESYEEEDVDSDFGGGFDDFEGFDEI